MSEGNLRVPINDKDHRRGPLTAPIQLIEYGDFECPFCAKAFVELEELIGDMGDEMCFVYRHFPLRNQHPHAEMAALSTEAADRQGKFWELHHLLYENQPRLSVDTVLDCARDAGIDLAKFEQDLSLPSLLEKVNRDFIGGVRSGVNGTPSLFLNGRRLDVAPTLSTLKGAILDAQM